MRKPICEIARECGETFPDESGFDEIAREENKLTELKWLHDELEVEFRRFTF